MLVAGFFGSVTSIVFARILFFRKNVFYGEFSITKQALFLEVRFSVFSPARMVFSRFG